MTRYRPTADEFLELARHGSLVPVYRQLVGDTLTAASALYGIQEGDWAFLFESVVGGERLGRYSFLGSGPFLRFQAFDRRVVPLAALTRHSRPFASERRGASRLAGTPTVPDADGSKATPGCADIAHAGE